MINVILLDEKSILTIVARHMARNHFTALRSARWLNGERAIVAAVLTKAERANRSAKPADPVGACRRQAPASGKPKTKKGKKS